MGLKPTGASKRLLNFMSDFGNFKRGGTAADQHGEYVAGNPENVVILPQARPQTSGDQLKQGVAEFMSQTIIDGFKAINIKK
jgi:hypothetical protein